jgi:site-specific recombinase XerD
VYATAARHLREFAQASKYAVDFDTITPTFGDRYTTYLLHQVKLTDNTVAKQVLTLKRFLRWARDRGYTDATGFDRLSWKRQEPDIMTLTADEVAALEQLVGAPWVEILPAVRERDQRCGGARVSAVVGQ